MDSEQTKLLLETLCQIAEGIRDIATALESIDSEGLRAFTQEV